MGLRERKKQETRSALSWAAIRLIVERGYDGVLVEDIAAAAGVSPRTFNNYYSGKAEAVAARHLDRCRAMAETLRSRPAGEPLWPAITEAVLAATVAGPEVTAHPRPDPAAWAEGLVRMLAVPAVQAETLRASFLAETEMAEAIAARTGTDPIHDMYPKLAAATVMAAFNVATAQFTTSGRGTSVRDLITDALAQLSAGLPEPKN